MNILIGTNLFYPLYGGGEKALIDWLCDFSLMGHEVTVITTMPDIEGYEKQFPFEVIRLSETRPVDLSIQNTLKDNKSSAWAVDGVPAVAYFFFTQSSNNYDMSYYYMKLGLEMIKDREFDIFIGYGSWGSFFKDIGTTFSKLLKESRPTIKTLTLVWDYYGGDGEFDSDYMLNPAPHQYIRNPYWPIKNRDNYILIPKQDTFERIDSYDYQEWLSRPYDFIFNNLMIHKGIDVIYGLAKHFRNKKFLLKRGNWGGNENFRRFEELANVDVIAKVESMEVDFFRQGRYLLYPSIYEGFGLMPLEATLQGTLPIISDIDILRYSSEPFSIFVYSEHLTNNCHNLIPNITHVDLLNYEGITHDWIEKINWLDSNEKYVREKYRDMENAGEYVVDRYSASMNTFLDSFK